MKDEKKMIDEKVLQDIFDSIVHHVEWLKKECNRHVSQVDFNRYLTGACYALNIAFDYDFDTCVCLDEFFDQKLDAYFGGIESE